MFIPSAPLAEEDALLPPMMLTASTKHRLTSLLSTRVGLAYRAEARSLRRELYRARILTESELPADVVTINSEVSYQDVATGDVLTATLVYPWRAHERRVLNVFSAVGTALLGQRVGDRIHWPLENGAMKVLHVLGVPYQPEAAGHAHL